MSGFALFGVVALHVAAIAAHEWPNCESDNCYRNFIDHRFKELGEEFCVDFLAATTTAPEAIPTEFGNCDGDVTAVSSACSCITYSISTTSDEPASSTYEPEPSSTGYSGPSTSDEPTEPSSTVPPESSISSQVSSYEPVPSSEAPEPSVSASESASESVSDSAYPSASDSASDSVYPSGSASPTASPSVSDHESSIEWTTSTIYETRTYTLTDCPADVECPGGNYVTTTTVAVYTTVCPVTESEPVKTWYTSKIYETEGPKPTHTVPYGTGSWVPMPTGPGYEVPTAGAGRVGAVIMAVAGALAIAL